MRSRGLVQDFMVDNVVNQARKERGTWEDEDPEGFWRYAFEVAAKRYNVRRLTHGQRLREMRKRRAQSRRLLLGSPHSVTAHGSYHARRAVRIALAIGLTTLPVTINIRRH